MHFQAFAAVLLAVRTFAIPLLPKVVHRVDALDGFLHLLSQLGNVASILI